MGETASGIVSILIGAFMLCFAKRAMLINARRAGVPPRPAIRSGMIVIGVVVAVLGVLNLTGVVH